MNTTVKSETVKITIPASLINTLKEASELSELSTSDYINYLIYKENFYYLSSNCMQKEKDLLKYYEKYCKDTQDKDMWTNLFNI